MTRLIKIGSSVFLLCLSLLAHAEQGSPQQHGGHHDFPEAVDGFHNVMAPLWHAPGGEQRQQDICTQYPALITQWKNIHAAASPADVDAAQWAKAVDNLHKVLSPIEQLCAENLNPEYMFANVHHGFHELVRLIGHEH